MDVNQLRHFIEDTLEKINLNSRGAVELLMLTAAVESHGGKYIWQRKGPALGIFQMEPATRYDITENFLRYKPDLMVKVNNFYLGYDDELMWNLRYAVIMARLHYRRRPEPLPKFGDIDGMAAYWKQHYNTTKGKGTIEKAVEAYRRYVL